MLLTHECTEASSFSRNNSAYTVSLDPFHNDSNQPAVTCLSPKVVAKLPTQSHDTYIPVHPGTVNGGGLVRGS